MAICNLFKGLTNDTGNFLIFDQYTYDLTKFFVQHETYNVNPSKFLVMDIDYKTESLGAFCDNMIPSADLYIDNGVINYNKAIPTALQNLYENACAVAKSTANGKNNKYTADTSKNIFWNLLNDYGLISIGSREDGGNTINYIEQLRYIGKIDIHSYEEQDGTGYSETYCYIPGEAPSASYYIKLNTISEDNRKPFTSRHVEGYTGYDTAGSPILPINWVNASSMRYCTDNLFDFDSAGRNIPEDVPSFDFNTIIVLYDVTDPNGVKYKDIPLGVYFTSKFTEDNSDESNNGLLTPVTKYVNSAVAYDSGSSYGLRIATKFVVTPNNTSISSISLDPVDQYSGFSRAMDKMKESQEKMNDVISDIYNNSRDIKNQLISFTGSKTNVPYVHQMNDGSYYWFVNGKNTGVKIETTKVFNTTYIKLLEAIDAKKLNTGDKYRITDYKCTTTQFDTAVADHQFDIIVTATGPDTLDEHVQTVLHDGDSYFKNANLSAWDVKYSIYNDKTRFGWADDVNGRGVIYYMKDEHGNVAHYDFKNILFKRYKLKNPTGYYENDYFAYIGCTRDYHVDDTKWLYTFSMCGDEKGQYCEYEDATVAIWKKPEGGYEDSNNAYNNTIGSVYGSYIEEGSEITTRADGKVLYLNNVVFTNMGISNHTSPGITYGSCGNTIGPNCANMTFDSGAQYNDVTNSINIIIYSDCTDNTIKGNNSDIVISNNCTSNIILTSMPGSEIPEYTYGAICKAVR